MNTERILELADFIEFTKGKFDYDDTMFNRQTGNCGCIGAHAGALWPEVRRTGISGRITWQDHLLIKFLGITQLEHQDLCYTDQADYSLITRSVAVATLRNFATTGEIIFKTGEPS